MGKSEAVLRVVVEQVEGTPLHKMRIELDPMWAEGEAPTPAQVLAYGMREAGIKIAEESMAAAARRHH